MVMIRSGIQMVIAPMDSNNEDFVAMAMASILVRPPGIPEGFGGVIQLFKGLKDNQCF